jgi:uncharacterized protein (DUF362 family)
MKLHPYLADQNSVLIFRVPLSNRVIWEDYRQASIRAMSAMQIELEGEKAVIKPNVTSGERFADPDSGITTHPGFVQGMVEYLQKNAGGGKTITIAEDPRNSDDNAPRHWHGTGYERVAQETGVRLYSPTTYTCVKKTVARPLVHATLHVSRLAVAPQTALFNVPKLKTHNMAITTLCMKNLMGLVNVFDRHYCAQSWQEMPEEVRVNPQPRHEWLDREMHERWQAGVARRLVDTAQVIRPALNIVEGIVGREGTGFQRGRNRPLGLVIAGASMVAVDSLASYLMGFDPQRLVYLRMAAEAGLGCNDIGQLHIYQEQGGELVLCQNVAALRCDPPFQVISTIKGENQDPFNNIKTGEQ